MLLQYKIKVSIIYIADYVLMSVKYICDKRNFPSTLGGFENLCSCKSVLAELAWTKLSGNAKKKSYIWQHLNQLLLFM